MYIRITNLEHNSRFENIQELRDSYYQEFIQSKPFFELNDNSLETKSFLWSTTGCHFYASKQEFLNDIHTLTFPLYENEYNGLINEGQWENYFYYSVEYYKYRFIHIPKTAGRHVFNSYGVYRHSVEQNHVTFKNRDYKGNTCIKKADCFAHSSLESIKNSAKRRFTVVRNPYDWLVSMYFTDWRNNNNGWADIRVIMEKKDKESFERFIDIVCDKKNKEKQIYKEIIENVFPFHEGMTTQLFDDTGTCMVENIIFFERLKEGLKLLKIQKRPEQNIGTEYDKKFKTYKKRSNERDEQKKDYRAFYTEEMIEKVSKAFKFDLDLLGYEFDGLTHKKALLKL